MAKICKVEDIVLRKISSYFDRAKDWAVSLAIATGIADR